MGGGTGGGMGGGTGGGGREGRGPDIPMGYTMGSPGSIVTLAALAWLFLRLAAEGELRQELLERGLDPRAVQRAVRYGRGQELSDPR